MGELVEYIARLRDIRVIRYGFASVVALGFDMGTFLLLLASGLASSAAAALGYSLGIAVHWILSSRTVFHDGLADQGAPRSRQKILFVLSAGVGLGITTTIVGLGDLAGLDPRAAKLGAVIVSFMVTYLLRKMIVFGSVAVR